MGAIFLSTLIILAVVLLLGRKMKLSSRYERSPKKLNSWSALDQGIDPSDEPVQ
ncbi:MAG: hypothetical protein O3A27_00655 [Actinomycetota bacterium]|nr:hypothetical protein [Actinomycetota bacterium]